MFDFQQLTDDFMGVNMFAKTNQIFVDPVTGKYCPDVLLTEQLLPVMCEVSG